MKPKDKDMHDQATDPNAMSAETSGRIYSNTETAQPTKLVPRHALITAIRAAKSAVEETHNRLVEFEQQRDDLARQLGHVQERVDNMRGERDYRSRHVRNLEAALNA
jgi:hypothetical protein